MGENKIKQLLTSVQKPGSLVLLAVLLFGSIFPQSFALPVKTAEAATGVPLLINFQGRLTNVSGGTNVANGTYTMRFKIYDALTSGTLLWTETRDQAPVHACQKVQVTAGVFNVKLGSCNSLSTVDFTSDSLYLSVDFDGGSGYDGEMSPRKQLVSAPYAINANNVAGSGKIDLTNTATTTVPFKLTANTLTTASGLTLNTTNNSAANTAWTGATLTFNNNQATTAVSTGSIAGLDIQFNQNTAIAGNNETAARINLKQNDSSSTDATVASLLDLANNDTATGNQITVTDGLKISGSNITNGINLSGTFASNLITSTNFTVAQSGQITSANLGGGGTQCLQASNTGVISGTGGACGGTTTLQSAYGNDVDGSDATISLTTADDSVVFSNPASSGTDSAFVLQSANLATGVTTNNFKNFFASSTGSFDATSGALTNYGGYFTNTSTRSAGSNAVTNVGLYATASGAQNNYAAIFDAGNVGIGTTTPTGTLEVKSTSSTSLVIGPNGATNPGLQIDSSVGSAATGIKITGNAAGSGVTFAAISSGSNENILFRPLGTGSLDIRPTTSGTSFRVLRVSDANPQATIDDTGKLVLAGDIDYHSRIQFRAAGGDGSFEVNSQGGASLIGKFSGTAAGLRFNGDVGIERVGTNAARITNASTGAGKLIVGDSTAGTTSRLTVASDLTASAWGLNGIAIQGTAATYTDSSTAISGTATNAVFNSFGIPTLAASNTSVTTTNAANVYIAGAPAAGTNQTITNAYALWVDAGTTRLDGTLNLSSITGSTQCLNVDTNGNVSGTGSSCGGSTTLQQAYGYDVDGSDATISLTTADDSIVVTNPSSSGTDSTFTFKIDQAASGAVDALSILNAGTGTLILADNSNASGNGVSIDVQSSSASQYALKVTANNGASNALWVGGDGRVGINNTAPATLLTVGNGTPTSASSGLQFGGDTSANLYRSASATIKTDGTLNVVTALQLNTNSQLVRYTDGTHGNMVRIYDTADNRGQLLLSPNGTPTFTRSRLVLSMTDLPADGTNFGMFTLAARADDSAYWLSTERGGTGSLYPIKFRINDGGSYSDIMYLGTDGKVGIGDTSPASLFTVGSGDLFQINTSGQIGSQVAPTSDYLFALAGTTGNDHSRIIDITQANDAAEDSYGISIVNTVNPGTVGGGTTRTVRNAYTSLTPTGTVQSPSGGVARLNIYGTDQAINLSNTTVGSTASNGAYLTAAGSNITISGSPVINNTDASGDNGYHLIYGDRNTINLTPTLTSVSGVNADYYASYNSATVTSGGNAGYVPTVYGIYSTAGGNLTTTGATAHYGGYFTVTGTADDNYGLSVSAVGGTNNYGLYIANPSAAATNYALYSGATAQSYFNGSVGIGATIPSQKLHVQDGSILINSSSTFTPTTLAGGFDTSGQNVNVVFVSGKYAYVGQSVNSGTCSGATVTGCEVAIFDIHNPSNPVAVAGINTAKTVNTIFVSGKYAYIGTNSDAGTCSGTTLTGCEFAIYDISNPSSPTAIVGYSFNQHLNSIFVQGKFAYLGFETDNTTGAEFVVLDLSVINGANVSAIGSVDTADATAGEGSVKSVYVQGRYAYLGLSSTTGTACTSGDATSCDFRIYDISNPFSPTYRGGTNPGIAVNSVTVSGKYAYAGFASVSGNDFQIYNIADPTAPTATAGIDLSTGVNSIHIQGKYAFIGKISASGNDFQILDITDPTATPVDAGGVDITFDVRSVFVSGKYAYIGNANTASSANEFRVLDIAGIDTPTITAGAAGIGQLSVTDNARIENELTVGTALNVGLGGINTAGPVTIESILTGQSSGAGVAGVYGNYTLNNSTNSVFQYGNRFVTNITAVEDSNVDSTYIGELIRIVDTDCDTGATALDCDNTVRGLEVQSWTGNNTAGINTAIAGFGKTFGIQGTTDALAGGVSQPAAVFADLDNGSAATVGNAIRAYTNNATSADLVSFYQETTAYTGTGLLMNFGNNSGSYTGNFIDLQKAGSSKYKINFNNSSDITTETFGRTGSITDWASGTNGNTYIWKIPQKATTGTCATATAEGMIFQNTGGTQVGHICIDGPTSGTPNKLRFYAEQFNATSTDLAENYSDVTGKLSAGEVVSFDLIQDKAIVQANAENSENLAGIISTAPGLLLTDASEDGTPSELVNPKPLAISGRVPVKVTDENGIIKKGDHLTVSLTKPGFAMKAKKAGITLGQAISDSKDGYVTAFVNLTTWNGKKSGLPKEKSLTGEVKIPTELLKELSEDNSDYLSEIFTDRVVARDVVSDTISTNTLSVTSLKFIEKDGLSLDNAFVMKGGLKVDSISSITDLIKMNSDVEFIGTPFFNKDTAGFAKIIAGTKEIRIEFEKEYLVKPIVTANLSFERDENTREDDQIKNEELDVQAAFSGVQFVIINKNTKGFTILLNKKAPRDLSFSWIALAVKDATTFVSKDLTAEEKAQEQTQEQEQIKEQTPTEESINTTEETKTDATQSTKENSDKNEKIKVETKEEAGTKEQ